MPADFLLAAARICGAAHVSAGSAIEPRYLEPARYAPGQAAALARPASTAELAQLLPLAARHGLRVLPQGAHTGLVRAATPVDAESDLLLSTERMREVFELDLLDRTLRVSAGFRLGEINERLAAHDLMLAIDLSADPSVGGMLAHNTGGTRMLRYGDVRANTLGLTVVLAEGQVLRLGRGLQKDNAALPLQQLFIGSSGSLGVISEAVFKLASRPRQQAVALVSPSSLEAVLPLYQSLMSAMGSLVSACEGMSRPAMEAALSCGGDLDTERMRWFGGDLPEYTLLVELSSDLRAEQLDLQALLQTWLEGEFGERVSDAVLGADAACWALRHHISEGLRARGKVLGFDVSLPRRHFMAFREAGRAWLAEHFAAAELADFGHLGDGGLHFNLVWPQGAPALDEAGLRAGVYALVQQFEGSFSAEHGIGPQLQDSYWQLSETNLLDWSGRLQRLFDPQALLGLTHWGTAAINPSGLPPDAAHPREPGPAPG